MQRGVYGRGKMDRTSSAPMPRSCPCFMARYVFSGHCSEQCSPMLVLDGTCDNRPREIGSTDLPNFGRSVLNNSFYNRVNSVLRTVSERIEVVGENREDNPIAGDGGRVPRQGFHVIE